MVTKKLNGFASRWIYAAAKTISTLMQINRVYGISRSLFASEPIDLRGEPVPWFTFSAIEYLRSFDLSNSALFEYGAGNSTLFWARRCKRVVSVEHDPNWFQRLNPVLPKNVELVLGRSQREYVSAISSRGVFDIVVIDGKWRNFCVDAALRELKSDGFIILDNADWYPSIASRLRSIGLFEVDFNGFSPLNRFAGTTSFFFRSFSSQSGFSNPKPFGGRIGGEFLGESNNL